MTHRLTHARGRPLEAHEASYQRVVATVRRVGIGAGEQLVEAALRIRFRSRNAEAKLPQPWRADRNEQRCDAPSMLPQVASPASIRSPPGRSADRENLMATASTDTVLLR